MTFEYLPYFEITIPDKQTIINNYSLIWINVDVKWPHLQQFELKDPKMPVASLPKVLKPVLLLWCLRQ